MNDTLILRLYTKWENVQLCCKNFYLIVKDTKWYWCSNYGGKNQKFLET